MTSVLLCLGAVLALSVFLTVRGRVNPNAAPLLALCVALLYFSLAGVLGVLRAGGWVFYLLCAALAAFALATPAGRQACKKLLAPGFCLFVAGAVLLAVYLAVRQPLFSEWDEFVFWGTAPKLLWQDNALYTTANMGWAWTATQHPGLPVLGYFAHFFAGGFAPWRVYWVYDILMLASACALLSPFAAKQWRAGLPLVLAALLAPYFFTVFSRQIFLTKVYLSAYAEIPAGMLLAAALALYFAGRGKGGALWQALVPLAAFVLIKDNLLVVALVAAGVMAADCLLFPLQKRPLWRRWVNFLVVFACTLVPYVIWKLHAGWANSQNPVTGGADTTSMPIGQAVVATLRQLLGLQPATEKFTAARQGMASAFFTRDVSMAGPSAPTLLLLAALFALAFALHQTARQRRRIALCGVLLAGGYLGFQFVMLVSYAFIFKYDAVLLHDYDRYFSTYYLVCFLLALFFVVLAALRPDKTETATPPGRVGRVLAVCVAALFPLYQCVSLALQLLGHIPKSDKFIWQLLWAALGALLCLLALLKAKPRLRATTGGLALAVACVVLFAAWVPAGLSTWDYADAQYRPQRATEATAQQLAAHLSADDRVFFVCQGGDGQQWFEYSYYLLPAVLDYSISGGSSLVLPPDTSSKATPTEALRAYLTQQGCEFILVAHTDDAFTETYAALFTDGLASATGGSFTLYALQADGLYAPIDTFAAA